jgi:hypothetical protein
MSTVVVHIASGTRDILVFWAAWPRLWATPYNSASVEDVYRDLTMRILSREHTLAILYVPKDPGQVSQFDLPSWIPDLSHPTDTASLTGMEHNYSQPCKYKAATVSAIQDLQRTTQYSASKALSLTV